MTIIEIIYNGFTMIGILIVLLIALSIKKGRKII